jgi:hypothetical protein
VARDIVLGYDNTSFYRKPQPVADKITSDHTQPSTLATLSTMPFQGVM